MNKNRIYKDFAYCCITSDWINSGFGETPQKAWQELYSRLQEDWPEVTPGNVLFFKQITPSWLPPGGFVITHEE